jgi:hypothetical protein
MKTLNFQLVGKTPLLLHEISRHQLREQLALHEAELPIEEEVLKVMVKDSVGNPVVPVSWLWDSIRVGCSRITVREGKQLSFQKLQSVVNLPEGYIPVLDREGSMPKVGIYSSMQHASPGSRKPIAVVSPMIKLWSLTFNVVVVGEHLEEALLRKVFLEAGRVGIGLFHPPKKYFGQFSVTTSGGVN